MAQRFIEVPHQNFGRPSRPERISYPEVCTWSGSLTFSKLTKDESLKTALIKRFDPLLEPVAAPGNRARIMQGYKSMMEALLKYQAPSGMWNQLIDDPTSWPESSCTGMFAYGFITGVKEGWLDTKTYGPAAKKAWLALITYLDEKSDVREVCQGTNTYNAKRGMALI